MRQPIELWQSYDFSIPMYVNLRESVAGLCKSPTVRATAILAGAFAFHCCAFAQNTFPAPMAPRTFTKLPITSDSSTDRSPLTPESPGPLGPVTESWEGMSSDFTLEPPDPHGAAGPNGILQVINVRLAYWDKQGTPIWGPTSLDTFFGSTGNNSFSFDPKARFDPQSGRFYVLLLDQEEGSETSYFELAVSKTSNPRSSTSSDWYFYRINNTRTVGSTRYWGDYPGLAFDSQAIYITLNMYSFDNFGGDVQISVLNKSSFLSGSTNYAFIYTSAESAAFTLQPCTVTGGNSPSNVAYFAETPITGDFSTSVRIWALKDPLGLQLLSSVPVSVPNNGGTPPFIGAPQPGTSITIDTLDGRTQGNAFWYNGSVWFCTTAGGSTGKSVVHYYKINLNNYPSGVPSVGEAGFIDGGPGEWTYQPSIGANSRGDVGIVYCQSSSSRYPTIFAAIHSASDTSFGTPVLIKASPNYYFGGRWGDYGSTTADPVDDSFWVTHEWAKTRQPGAWSTWWAQLNAPGTVQDGILEVGITPPNGATLLAGTTQKIFVQVTDALAVTNASVVATVNGGTNLVFQNNGASPDVTANDAFYSANLSVPNSTNSLTLSFLITAPGKTNTTNIVTYSVVPVPVNDFFTNAIKVPPAGALYLANNQFATRESGEPQHAGVPGAAASLWWSWSPATSTNVFVDTTGSGVDTIVGVYQGVSVNALTTVIATNDVGTKKQAYLSFNATGGASYRIAVASVDTNSTGSLRLLIAPGGSADTNPPTLNIVSPLSGQWVSNFLLTVSGTANDPQPNASGVSRVLLSVNGRLPLTATGTTNWSSSFGLTEGLNQITVTAEDVAGNVSASTTIEVSYIVPNPVNDLFANAIPLSGNVGTVTAITTNATKEFNEPFHAGNAGGKSVWWSFLAPADGALSLTTSNSTFDTLLGLYTGASVSTLTTVASNDEAYEGAPGGFSALTTAVQANQTYYISVDGFDGASGVASLGYTFTGGSLFSLTISNAGNGQVSPASGNFVSNTTVVLTAMPDPFFEFVDWTGSFGASANPLSVVVNSNISLTANFRPITFTDDFETGNFSRLTWFSSTTNHPWVVQTNTVLAGHFSARSGAITNSQTSSLVLTTNFQAGNVSFYFKVSSEPDYDMFSFYVDGVQQQQWSGDLDWSSFSLPLAAGTHTLEWRYAKDPSLSQGLDAAFIDNVLLPFALPIDSSTAAHLQLLRKTDGSLLLQVLGQTNRQYVIQGATSLSSPINWQNLSTNVATDGTIQYIDPGTATNPIRFYRAIVP
jgi:hypothetical protein